MYNNGQLVPTNGSYNYTFKTQKGNKQSYIRKININLKENFEIWILYNMIITNFRNKYSNPFIKVENVIFDGQIGVKYLNQIYKPPYLNETIYRKFQYQKSLYDSTVNYWYPIYIAYYYDKINNIYKGVMSDYQLVFDFDSVNPPIENKDIYFTLRGFNEDAFQSINPILTFNANRSPRFLYSSPNLDKFYCFGIPIQNINEEMYILCNGDGYIDTSIDFIEIETFINYRKITNVSY